MGKLLIGSDGQTQNRALGGRAGRQGSVSSGKAVYVTVHRHWVPAAQDILDIQTLQILQQMRGP